MLWWQRAAKESGRTFSVKDVAESWGKNEKLSEMAEKMTEGFVDSAKTVYERLLKDPVAGDIVWQCEEHFGKDTPWNSVYKMEAVVKKCGRHPGSIASPCGHESRLICFPNIALVVHH